VSTPINCDMYGLIKHITTILPQYLVIENKEGGCLISNWVVFITEEKLMSHRAVTSNIIATIYDYIRPLKSNEAELKCSINLNFSSNIEHLVWQKEYKLINNFYSNYIWKQSLWCVGLNKILTKINFTWFSFFIVVVRKIKIIYVTYICGLHCISVGQCHPKEKYILTFGKTSST
jgi:hypothetical protein